MDTSLYQVYLNILKAELVPAMGCTEPIAIAYAAALAAQTLGAVPEEVEVFSSPNIIKNVKSVVVPHTGGLQGIPAAAAAGIISGRADLKLEVLSGITQEQIRMIRDYLEKTPISSGKSDKDFIFDIQVRVRAGQHTAFCEIAGSHTNVIRLEKDEEVLICLDFCEEDENESGDDAPDYSLLNIRSIVDFADQVKLEDVRETLDRQIQYNTAISEEGLREHWGAQIGRVLMRAYGASVQNRAKAAAAAASDARMSGCELPVVINSGSGNQGITCSLPVIVYAREIGVSEELLLRALVVSNLVTIHLKTGIGRLSAYCGATSAGCGAGAGITYLYGGKYDEISHTVVNAIAIDSGMICDGAKPSCAAKIASAVEAGLLGWQMQSQGTEFFGGDGIVTKGVEETIKNVGRVARIGMAGTDREIIDIMIRNC
ncbi:MAG: serine dehydratase subunit alpha family protein [Lachnospiraceae bacterium]|nr:serine dehydratase subunit alpha family protein [Lachnospiraceae bacterium]